VCREIKNPDWPGTLVNWYEANKRDLPWRRTTDPYLIWLSEVMLQQTRVDTVIPYYNRWKSAFPDVHSVANAPLDSLLKLWEGLGYYSRCRNFQRACAQIVENLDGRIPSTFEELKELPGVGPYIAAAVSSIAFGESVPVVDGNVLRVVSRFTAFEEFVNTPRAGKQIFNYLVSEMGDSNPSSFNQGLMELGALICKPKAPDCVVCPISSHCTARMHNRVEEFPRKIKKKSVPHYHVSVAVIERGESVLLQKRPPASMLGGLWELPGGKCENEETCSTEFVRKIQEDTGFQIEPLGKLGVVKHAYSHFKITIQSWQCHIVSDTGNRGRLDTEWALKGELGQYPMPVTTRKLVSAL
jgi:A/G-specific adenine glycosylase